MHVDRAQRAPRRRLRFGDVNKSLKNVNWLSSAKMVKRILDEALLLQIIVRHDHESINTSQPVTV